MYLTINRIFSMSLPAILVSTCCTSNFVLSNPTLFPLPAYFVVMCKILDFAYLQLLVFCFKLFIFYLSTKL